MSFHLYKEGQGIWARGVLAAVIGVSGLFAAFSFYRWFETNADRSLITIPGLNWSFSWQMLVAVGILIPFFAAGLWCYNHPRLANFLIDTESELKNKVTWPSRKEVANNSIVVVVTCVLMGLWVAFSDSVFRLAKNWVYGI